LHREDRPDNRTGGRKRWCRARICALRGACAEQEQTQGPRRTRHRARQIRHRYHRRRGVGGGRQVQRQQRARRFCDRVGAADQVPPAARRHDGLPAHLRGALPLPLRPRPGRAEIGRVGRQRRMPYSAAPQPGLRMRRLARSLDHLEPRYDAVVVGSGYGGGVAASRLARAGKRVAVLERGREIVTGEFPSRFPDLRGDMQVTGRRLRLGSPTGLYDVRLGEDMHVLVGCGLGGGSLVNAGVALRPDARVFRDAAWPPEVAGDGLLDEAYARAARWVRPARDEAAAQRAKFKALQDASAALGKAPVQAPVVVSFAANVNPAGVEQPACTHCGDCCGGCNVGAKNTVALTYLPDAARHGARIFTHAKVSHVSRLPDGGWQVHFARLDGDGGRGPGAAGTVTADIVVLSAGTLGSTEILLRSRERGLAVSDRLGKGFSANGDIIAFGYGAKLPVNAIGVGHPAKVDG